MNTGITMSQMAVQYRDGAHMLQARIEELKQQLARGGMGEMEKLTMRSRLGVLGSMQRDALETAFNLERYYDKRCKRSERFKV